MDHFFEKSHLHNQIQASKIFGQVYVIHLQSSTNPTDLPPAVEVGGATSWIFPSPQVA